MRLYELANDLNIPAGDLLCLAKNAALETELTDDQIISLKKELERIDTKSDHRYIWHGNEPAIFREIYLPKKAAYQGTLYQTLTDGFNLEYEQHFHGPEESKIKQFLENYKFGLKRFDEFVSAKPQVLSGYSIYEIDGVFYSRESGATYEERTQVIRLIFRPDLKWLGTFAPDRDAPTIREYVSKFLSLGSKAGIPLYEKLYAISDPGERLVIDNLNTWLHHTGFFLFGYLVYKLAEGVLKREEEIWVVGHWNVTVHRTILECNQ